HSPRSPSSVGAVRGGAPSSPTSTATPSSPPSAKATPSASPWTARPPSPVSTSFPSTGSPRPHTWNCTGNRATTPPPGTAPGRLHSHIRRMTCQQHHREHHPRPPPDDAATIPVHPPATPPTSTFTPSVTSPLLHAPTSSNTT